MKSISRKHLYSIALILTILGALFFYFQPAEKKQIPPPEILIELSGINFNDPFDQALLRESFNKFYPPDGGDSLLSAIDTHQKAQIIDAVTVTRQASPFGWTQLWRLIRMGITFCLVYLLVLWLSYYGIQTLAVWKFVRFKQNRPRLPERITQNFYLVKQNGFSWKSHKYVTKIMRDFFMMLVKSLIYLVLFSPAYVIAYSVKTRFDTDSVFFMILLGILSNGLLIYYSQKFYTFLIAESRKGYVRMATVKGLASDYNSPFFFAAAKILKLRKKFSGHVFDSIFKNARLQYISSFKEQAAFLITGLIIIEMALNIQNHLCYELLKTLLYAQHQSTIFIVSILFLIVKGTEWFTDTWLHREMRRYDNE